MSVAEVTARIGHIQAQFALLGVGSGSGIGSTSSATAFAGALDTASTTGAGVVAEAKKYLGVPYVWGGTDPGKGLDCSGLVQLVYKNLGYDLPRLAGDQVNAGRKVASLADARPGDLLGFGSPMHHVGIFVGDNMMIEAPRPGKAVRIAPIYEKPSAIGRILPEHATSAAAIGGLTGPSAVPAGTPYASLFARAGQKYGVDPGLLAIVAKQESGYNANAVSPAGAQGLMQLMPATAKGLGVTNAFDPAQAVDGAAKLLHGLIQRFGRTDLALAAYNAGPGAVLKYGGIPPYAETQHYVKAIMAQWGRNS